MNAMLEYMPVLAATIGNMAGTAAPENNLGMAFRSAPEDKASGRNRLVPMPIQGALIA